MFKKLLCLFIFSSIFDSVAIAQDINLNTQQDTSYVKHVDPTCKECLRHTSPVGLNDPADGYRSTVCRYRDTCSKITNGNNSPSVQ